MTETFIVRLQEVNAQVNCVSWDNFVEAQEIAESTDAELDKIYTNKAETNWCLSDTLEKLRIEQPFLGVPFTCKESFCVKGTFYNHLT